MIVYYLNLKLNTFKLFISCNLFQTKKASVLPLKSVAHINKLFEDKIRLAANCCLYELKDWCEKKLLVPRDDDEVFCGGFDYVEKGTTLIDIRIFVTTKRLLSYMKISSRENECILLFLLYLFFTIYYFLIN
jgi:hypothetical protein